MPLLANAKKALRSSRRKQVVNNRTRSQLRTAVDASRTNPTPESLAAAYSALDLAVKNNVIHGNKAARLKSQLSKLQVQA